MKTLIFASVLLIPIYLFTGCNGDDNHMDEDQMEETEQMENHEMNSGNVSIDSSIIRGKNWDVASIDQNGDGKVYQCPMDYEVISDHKVNCPLCMMELEEYSIKKSQQNFNNYMN